MRQNKFHAMSGAERRIRADLIRETAKRALETGDKPGFRNIARRLNLSPATLSRWAYQNMPKESHLIAKGPGRRGNPEELIQSRTPKLRAILARDPVPGLGVAARELGITYTALRAWLIAHDSEILQEFMDKAPSASVHALPPEEALRRARYVKVRREEGARYYAIAGELGITPAALSFWLTRNAAHGLDELIEMLDDDVEIA